MTAVTDLSSRAAPRRHWIVLVALALSLTLNVFVLGGLVWSMTMARPPVLSGPGERLLAAARDVDLSAEQRTTLAAFIASAREQNRELRGRNGVLMHKMWQEMGKTQPDSGVIGQLSEQTVQNRLGYQKRLAAGLMSFLATLSPAQRSQLVTLVQQRPPLPPPR